MKNLDGDDVVDVFHIFLGDTEDDAGRMIPRGPGFGNVDSRGIIWYGRQAVGLIWSWATAEANGLGGIHADKVVVRAGGHVNDQRRSLVANVASALNDEVYWIGVY